MIKFRDLEFTNGDKSSVPENQIATGIDLDVFDPEKRYAENDGLTYRIIGGPEARYFALDQDGILTFKEPPDYETPRDTQNVYQVTVIAFDGLARSTEQKITVAVTDKEDSPADTWDRVSVGMDAAFVAVDLFGLGYLRYLRMANIKKAEAIKDGLSNIETIADRGEFTAKVGEVLPGAAGRAFRQMSLDLQFVVIKRNTEKYIEAVDTWLETQGGLSTTTIKIIEALSVAAGIWTAITLTRDSLALAEADQNEAGPSPLPPPFVPPTDTPPTSDSDVGLFVLASDGGDAEVLAASAEALETRHAALVSRFDTAHAPTVSVLEEIEERSAQVYDSVQTEILSRIERIDAAIAEIKAAARDIEAVRDEIVSFVESVGSLSDLIDPILTFLENPPSLDLGLFEVPLFGPLNRNNIEAILDFFQTINGVIDTALGWIIDPILGPIDDEVRALLPNLDPLSSFTGIMDRITDALNALKSEFDALEKAIADLKIDLDDIAEIDIPLAPEFAGDTPHDPSDTKVTFFGSDAAEEIVGTPRTGALAEGDIPGAAIQAAGGNDTVHGTAVADYLTGDAGDDAIFGNAGDDLILGGSQPDVLHGGLGNDTLFGGTGDDLMFGGDGTGADPGNDVFVGGSGFDIAVLSGLLSESTVSREGEVLTVTGPNGTDRFVGVEVVRFDDADAAAAQEIEGGFGSNLDGTAGNDLLLGASADDLFFGEDGDDTILGNAGNDIIVGGDGDDVIDGGPGAGDRAVFERVALDDNSYVLTDRGLEVVGPLGKDILRDIEFLSFSGVIYPISDFESFRPVIEQGAVDAEEAGGASALDLAGLTSDRDVRDDVSTFAFSVLDGPAAGAVRIDGTVLSFDPGDEFADLGAGETRVVRTTVSATDGLGATSRPQQVAITVTGVNDAPRLEPVARTLPAAMDEVFIDLAALASDPDPRDDPEDFTYAIVDGPSAGQVQIDGAFLSFSPNGRFDDLNEEETRDVFVTVTATDAGGATSEPMTVSLTVAGTPLPPNAPPLFLQLPRSFVSELAPVGTQIGRLSGFDPDGDRLDFEMLRDADGLFTLEGASVILNEPFSAGAGLSRSIAVRATDPDGEGLTQEFEIVFTEAQDQPGIGPTEGDDDLEGDDTAQTVDLLGGNDRYRALGGNDTVRGGDDDDTIYGGDGDDRILGGEGDDVLFDGLGTDTLDGGGGFDTFMRDLSEDYPDFAFLPILDLAAGRFYAKSTPQDFDTVRNFERVILSGRFDHDIRGTGVDEEFSTGAGADSLSGAGGRDTLDGGAGDDRLDGGNGADRMIGGQGSDYIIVDNAGDRVVESRNWEGQDTVESSVDIRIGRAHVEEIVLTGDAQIAVGNRLFQRIEGNAADNTLSGLQGNDTLVGGAGNDTYVVRAPGDTVVERAGEGIDLVRSTRTWRLEDHVEKLELLPTRRPDGTAIDGLKAFGNALDNVIIGNPFDNVLVGRGGNDTIRGGEGADRFLFDRAPGQGNVDRILDFDASEGDRLLFRRDAFDNLSKGRLSDALFREGPRALDDNDRFVWNEANGRLFFDADGDGPGGQRLVAIFAPGTEIEASDIFLV